MMPMRSKPGPRQFARPRIDALPLAAIKTGEVAESVQQFVDFAIETLEQIEFDLFCEYINDHLSDNGKGGTAYFQPLPRKASHFSPEKADAFRNALQIPVGAPGWRRLWVARGPNRQLIGHIDLRAHPERCAEHRCLLGMGVSREHRRLGLGRHLIAHAESWAAKRKTIAWIDLQVLSANEAAVRLYHRAGFKTMGEVPDMFHIDGQAFSYTTMTKKVDA
jgi:ribosomal protein S18 acetylase RimI-like enzyme